MLSTWLSSQKKITMAVESGKSNPKRKNTKSSKHNDIDNALRTWFISVRNSDVPMSVTILKKKLSNLRSR